MPLSRLRFTLQAVSPFIYFTLFTLIYFYLFYYFAFIRAFKVYACVANVLLMCC